MGKSHIWRKYLNLFRNRELDLLSGYLSFTTLLSIVPFCALILALAKWLGHRDKAALEAVFKMLDLITPDAAEKVRETMTNLFQNIRIKRLGLGALIPLGIILFSKLRMIRNSFRSVLGAHNNKEKPWMMDLLAFLSVVTLLPVAFSFFEQFLDFTASNFQWMVVVARTSKALLLSILIFVLMQLFAPLKTSVRREIACALLGGAFLFITNYVFSVVVGSVLRMNTLYGVFASVPIFLFWIYTFWRTVTLCVVFACEPHLQVADDGRVKCLK